MANVNINGKKPLLLDNSSGGSSSTASSANSNTATSAGVGSSDGAACAGSLLLGSPISICAGYKLKWVPKYMQPPSFF